MKMKLVTAVVLLLSSQVASAQSSPALYFKKSTCAPTDCIIAHPTTAFPNLSSYETLATLDLPAGTYLVTAKLGSWANGNWYNFECTLGPSTTAVAGSTLNDYSSSSQYYPAGVETTVMLQTPVTFSLRGGTVMVGCRVAGAKADGTPVEMHVWGVNISALKVGSVSIR